MSTKLCSHCNKRYGLYTVKDVLTCSKCFTQLYNKNSYGKTSEEKVTFLEQLNKNISDENLPQKRNTLKIETTETETSKPKRDSKVSTLEKFATNLSKLAADNSFVNIFGRDKEMQQLIVALSRKTKNNPVLIGEPGVGKSALIELLAHKIHQQEVPNSLLGKVIYSINTSSILSGTKFRGEFEDRMNKIIDELESRPDAILFVDEIHTINTSGSSDSSPSIAQILKPAMSRGTIQLIGTTTLEEYRIHIEKDAALDRRFQKIKIEEPSESETYLMLQTLKPSLEAFHNVSIHDEILSRAIQLSQQYIPSKKLPDKAIDLIDETCAYLNSKNNILGKQINHFKALSDDLKIDNESIKELSFTQAQERAVQKKEADLQLQLLENTNSKNNTVSLDVLDTVLSLKTNIPLNKISDSTTKKLVHLPKVLNSRVKGQKEVIEKIVDHTKIIHLNLKDKNKPNGVFLFLGPTGVGKTELAKSYADYILGDEKKMLRFDMSEYMEKHSVSKLIGTSPGYTGYSDGGKLTNVLRNDPYSIILFDEIEKAHPDVFNMLLQVFDEGRISDGKGTLIDCKNATFIMTSNIGAEYYFEANKGLGFNNPLQTVKNHNNSLEAKVMGKVKKTFRPEFINRLDLCLVFNPLSEDTIQEIVVKLLSDFTALSKESGITITHSEDVIKYITKNGFDKELGARPLQRKVHELKYLLANKIIEGNDSNSYHFDIQNDAIRII